MKRLAWSEVRSARQPGLKQELRVLIELLRVLPRPGSPMHLTVLPSNIMVGDDGSVLVSPARLEGAAHQERYLAPEVQRGVEPMLPAAIYAVGALLFEAVTGHRFETRDLVTQELAGARAMARAAGLGALFWEIYLLEAAAKATDEQPEKRWTSGSDFAEDLERVARDRIVTRAELGQLVAEVVEARGSSRPPARSSSGPPDATARAAPPPLPKKVRRRTSSPKQKATNAAQAQAAQAAQKAANAVRKQPRAAPIPRSDGDAPQMPLITALRVPNNLKLPESPPQAPAASASRAPAAAAPRSPAVASRVAAAVRTVTPLGLGAVTVPAPAPAPVPAPAAVPAPAPAPAIAAAPATAPAPAPGPASEPPDPSSPLPSFDSTPPDAPENNAGSTPPPGRFNPVTLGPRIDADPALPHKAGPSGVPVVVPSLSAPPAAPAEAGGSRRRTLTGTGDLRWLEGLQPPADVMDPNRHGTLVGLGMPAPTARLEPAFSEVEPATIPLSRSTLAPGRSSAPSDPRGPTAPVSSPTSNRSPTPSTPPSNRFRYVQPAPIDSSWDSVAGSESDARISSSDPAFLPKRSWMGRVLLAVVMLVALGIGTLGLVGHYTADDDKEPDAAAPKSTAERSDEPPSEKATAHAARVSDESPRAAEAEPAAHAPTTPGGDEPEPSAEVAEPSPAPAVEEPAGPPPRRAAPVHRAAPRPAPARAAPPPKPPAPAAPPAAPAPNPKGPDRDYGI